MLKEGRFFSTKATSPVAQLASASDCYHTYIWRLEVRAFPGEFFCLFDLVSFSDQEEYFFIR
jgi:hypothetical protein